MDTDIENKTIKQISVFLQNKSGKLGIIANQLKNAGVNIRAFSIADEGDWGIVRMIVDKPTEAYNILKGAGFTAEKTPVVGIKMEDVIGGMFNITEVFDKYKINLDYAYGFITKDGKSLLIVRVEETELETLIKNLEQENIKLLNDTELSRI